MFDGSLRNSREVRAVGPRARTSAAELLAEQAHTTKNTSSAIGCFAAGFTRHLHRLTVDGSSLGLFRDERDQPCEADLGSAGNVEILVRRRPRRSGHAGDGRAGARRRFRCGRRAISRAVPDRPDLSGPACRDRQPGRRPRHIQFGGFLPSGRPNLPCRHAQLTSPPARAELRGLLPGIERGLFKSACFRTSQELGKLLLARALPVIGLGHRLLLRSRGRLLHGAAEKRTELDHCLHKISRTMGIQSICLTPSGNSLVLDPTMRIRGIFAMKARKISSIRKPLAGNEIRSELDYSDPVPGCTADLVLRCMFFPRVLVNHSELFAPPSCPIPNGRSHQTLDGRPNRRNPAYVRVGQSADRLRSPTPWGSTFGPPIHSCERPSNNGLITHDSQRVATTPRHKSRGGRAAKARSRLQLESRWLCRSGP